MHAHQKRWPRRGRPLQHRNGANDTNQARAAGRAKSNVTNPQHSAGFTLLEVMVAFVIASLGSLVLYQAGFAGAAETVTAARYQEAVVRAQSRLASIGPLTKLAAQQASGDDGGGFHWRLDITPQSGNAVVALYNVRITESFGDREVTLVTQKLAPAR